ncbi:MAG TPA: sugar phosphate nucleotidyltransferase [Terracidiphilus sp.]|nr:sugar phosphate nucleotidyltransferase [Terracidiphilus sp.]
MSEAIAARPALLVLAAGMGSRYGGLKQIDPVGPSGEALMDYSIFDALRAGFGRVVFVIRRDIEEAFRTTIGARFEKHVRVAYAFQELDDLPEGFSVPAGRTKPWGTTQAILAARGVVHEPFAAINADDFYGAEAYRALAEHLTVNGTARTADAAMAGFVLRNTLSEFGSVARGICDVSAEGYLRGVVETTGIERDGRGARTTDGTGRVSSLTGDEVVSMNMWGFAPDVFTQLNGYFTEFLRQHGTELSAECYLPSAVAALIEAGAARVKVLPSGDAWFGVTYREDRARVVESLRELVRAGRYPERLWA